MTAEVAPELREGGSARRLRLDEFQSHMLGIEHPSPWSTNHNSLSASCLTSRRILSLLWCVFLSLLFLYESCMYFFLFNIFSFSFTCNRSAREGRKAGYELNLCKTRPHLICTSLCSYPSRYIPVTFLVLLLPNLSLAGQVTYLPGICCCEFVCHPK